MCVLCMHMQESCCCHVSGYLSDLRHLVSVSTDVHHRQSAYECYTQGQLQIPQRFQESDEEDELYEEV